MKYFQGRIGSTWITTEKKLMNASDGPVLSAYAVGSVVPNLLSITSNNMGIIQM